MQSHGSRPEHACDQKASEHVIDNVHVTVIVLVGIVSLARSQVDGIDIRAPHRTTRFKREIAGLHFCNYPADSA